MPDDSDEPSRQEDRPPRDPSTSRIEARAVLDALCAAAASGDHRAGETLYRRFTPGLRRLLLERVATPDIADELLQRTWMNAWAALSSGRYDPRKGSFSTFVYTIAHHIWLQHLRTARRADARLRANSDLVDRAESLASGGFPRSADPGDLAAFGQQLDRVRAIMRGEQPPRGIENDLTEDERAVLRAVASGVSDRALAVQLRLAPSTANARKRSAFDKLRRVLAEAGFRTDPASHSAQASPVARQTYPRPAERPAAPGE